MRSIPLIVGLTAIPLAVLTAQDSTRAGSIPVVHKAHQRGPTKDLPMQPGRTMDLDTDEGSWLSVDVSPDGQTIVFDMLGDLYAVPMSGGDATPLTSGMAFDAQPRFSPDGKFLTFTSDRDGGDNLWTMEVATRRLKKITKGKGFRYRSPEWTPDGQFIVASRSPTPIGASKLWMFHRDGGGGVQLVRDAQPLPPGTPAAGTLGAAFGKDDRYIWFAQRRGSWEYNASLPQYQVATFDRQTGRRETRTNRFGGGFRPTLSPDGRYLVYGSRHETQTGLRIRDLDTSDERWLAYPVQRDEQESVASLDVMPGMSFTPDSRAVVVSYGGKLWRVPVDGTKPSAIPFRVRATLEIGPEVFFRYRVEDSPTFTARQIRDAVPSPDGKRLAFVSLDRLYLLDIPGGTPRRVTDLDVTEAQPAWSPDGEWLAFVTWAPDSGGHLYKVRVPAAARGSAPARPVMLARQPALYTQPAWSPNGNRIVVLRGSAQVLRESGGFAQPTDIVWISSAGGGATFISSALGRSGPHFTSDTGRIFMYGGSDGLVSIRWDGTDQRTHLRVTGAKAPEATQPANAALVRMAPTGDQALVQSVNDLYVVSVPYAGSAPAISLANFENSEVPVRRLTDVGGQFPVWGSDGRKVYYSIGRTFFTYDLDRARQMDDSIAAAREARAGAGERDSAARADSTARAGAGPASNPRGYQPAEMKITIPVRRDTPEGQVVLRNARLITMRGEEVIDRGDILVRNNRLASVGPSGSLQVPAGTREIDLAGKTVVPGYVDTHAHLRLQPSVHTAQPWSYLANLAYGVTTTRDPQTGSTDVLSYEDAVSAGTTIGPRIYSTGPGIFSLEYQPGAGENIRDLDHARRIMRRYSEHYDTKTIKMYLAGNRQQRQWIMMAAREQRIMPTTEGGLDYRYDLTMALDGYPGQEHSLPVFPLYKDVVSLFAKSRIAYTPTLLVSYGGPWGENFYYATEKVYDDAKLARFTPYDVLAGSARRRVRASVAGGAGGGWFMPEEYPFTHIAKVANDIVKAGGRVGVGSHGQLQGLGYHWELWSLASGGMRPMDALRAATLHGAEAIGLEADVGSIEAGKLADLVVLEANPLENIRNSSTVRYVMKNGRLYDGGTLDEIWPRQKKGPVVPGAADPPKVEAGVKP